MIVNITERENGTLRVAITCEGDSKTEQHHTKQCDINNVIKKYMKGVMPTIKQNGKFGDFSNAEDFLSMHERIQDAREDFYKLPAALRKRFENDPSKIIEFLADPNNRDEAIALGLIEQPESNGEKDSGPGTASKSETEETKAEPTEGGSAA